MIASPRPRLLSCWARIHTEESHPLSQRERGRERERKREGGRKKRPAATIAEWVI